MKYMRRSEKGFTLVELLVAIPIIGVLGLSMSAVLIQLLRSDNISERMAAMRQVQSAGYSVSQDGVQSQAVTFGDDISANDWSLVMHWTGQWTDNTGVYNSRTITVTYTLVDPDSDGLHNLQRREVGEVIVGATTEDRDLTNTVGDNLDVSQMSCEWQDIGENSFSITVVATVGTHTEERTYNVAPRPMG